MQTSRGRGSCYQKILIWRKKISSSRKTRLSERRNCSSLKNKLCRLFYIASLTDSERNGDVPWLLGGMAQWLLGIDALE